MKICWFNAIVRQRIVVWTVVITALSLMPVVYAFLDSNSTPGSRVARELSVSERADRARIWGALGTMEYLDEMIESRLFDPENENPLKVGEPSPDFELMPLRFYDFAIDRGITKSNAGTLYDPVTLSGFRGSLPVVLIFVSSTSPAFKDQAALLNDMARKYAGRVQFFVVYIKETDSSDDRAGQTNPKWTTFKNPEKFLDRALVANTCMSELGLDIPCLVDDMENTTTRIFKSRPARL